jgi:hypothetical protein
MFDAAKEDDEKAGNGECQLILKEEWSDLLSRQHISFFIYYPLS